jgi:uncharacterized protein
MSVILWLVRVLVILFIIRLVVSFFRGTLAPARGTAKPRGSAAKPERIGGKLVQDPECGTYIPEERAIRHGRGDRVQFFCSVDCRDKWLARGADRAAAE